MGMYRWSRRRTRQFGEVWVPLAFVEFQRTENSFQAFAVQIDSGAVITLLRRSVADLLGLELDAGRRVELGSVGGASTIAYVHDVYARFGPTIQFCIPVAIANTETVPNLLGRLGVFDQLQVDFDASVRQTKISAPWLDDTDRRIWEFFLDTCKHIEQRWGQLDVSQTGRRAIVHFYNHASRLVAAVAGLIKLHREHEAPILLRAKFEVSAQFEFLMQDVEPRSDQFMDYANVSRYKRQLDVVKDSKGPISERVASSPLRPEGEPRLREAYDRVRHRFQTKKGKDWNNWHGMTLSALSREIGWEREYHLWYRSFSHWVHSDPSRADRTLDYDKNVLLTFSYHYLARMLLRIRNSN